MTLANETRRWRLGATNLVTGRSPLLMGIINVTPDSFSDGGEFLDSGAAVRHAQRLVEDGADILDVGGESTRPGSAAVSLEVELARVVPVIGRICEHVAVPVSIDTTKAAVAREAIAAGAVIVNDVSGLAFDPEMTSVCANTNVGVVCMHIRGTPRTMQQDPQYMDVVGEICEFLEHRLDKLETAGIARERVVIDPGIGFGKTAGHNIEILSNIARFRALDRPVLIGHSRKRFLGKVVGRQVDERAAGTIGVSIALAGQFTDIIRVHDVAAVRDALLAWRTVSDRSHKIV